MRRYLALLLVVALAGCSRPAAAPEPVPPSVEVAAPEPEPPVTQPEPPMTPSKPAPEGFPRQAFWGAPGTLVEGDDGSIMSKAFAGVPFGAVTLFPVETVGFWDLFFSLDGDRLQLSGILNKHYGYFFLAGTPTPLGALPYSSGNLPLQNEFARAIEGFETVSVPAGSFPAVVFATEGGRQWWSPGVGLVQYESPSGALTRAARILRTEPELHRNVVRFPNQTTALLTTDGVHTQDGAKRVSFGPPKGTRATVGWTDIGAGAPVASRGDWSQVFPQWWQTYYSFRPASKSFEPVVWRFPTGEGQTQVAGMVEEKDGAVFLEDAESYPETRYRFQWANGELKAVEALARPPKSEEAFVRMLTHPLRREAWLSLFTDPATGQRAYDSVFKDGQNALSRFHDRFTSGKEGVWILGSVRLTVTKSGQDWRVTSWNTVP